MGKALNRIFDVFEVYLGVAIFALLILSTFIQVFMRYVLNMPSPELFEISIYCFVWVIYLGGALASRYDQHIRFDLIYRKFGKRTKLVLDIVFDLFTSAILLVLLVPSFAYTIRMYAIKASALRIPWTFLLVVYPIFILLVIAHSVISILFKTRELGGGPARPAEVLPWE